MQQLTNTTIQAVQRICADLRPAILDDYGLAAAIEWQAQDFESRTGIRCYVTLDPAAHHPPPEQATTIFRIFQESLTNVGRHAQASEVEVTMGLDCNVFMLEVKDNGIGIANEKVAGASSFGLAGMRERALRWDGQVDISGIPGKGSTVTLTMPIGEDGKKGTP